MADLNKIQLPDGNTYTIKDDSGTASDHLHDFGDLSPAVTKIYTNDGNGYIGTGDNWDSTTWYFMYVKPDEWYKPWHVRFRITSYVPTSLSYQSSTWSDVFGRADSVTYANFNELYNSAHYYVAISRLNATGYNNGYRHAIGISIRYSSGYTSTSYKRNFKLEYFWCDSCTVTILDTPLAPANIEAPNTTNRISATVSDSLDAINRGLRETSDDNDTTTMYSYYARLTSGSNGIMQNSLAMQRPDGTIESFTTTAGTGTSKTKNTHGFVLGKLVYCNTGTVAANTLLGYGVVRWYQALIDYRYSFNFTTTPVANKMIYIVGSMGSDSLFYLDDTWWTQTLPTSADGKIYIPICVLYADSTPYRGDFYGGGDPLIHNGTAIVPYSQYDYKKYTDDAIATAITTTLNTSV